MITLGTGFVSYNIRNIMEPYRRSKKKSCHLTTCISLCVFFSWLFFLGKNPNKVLMLRVLPPLHYRKNTMEVDVKILLVIRLSWRPKISGSCHPPEN